MVLPPRGRTHGYPSGVPETALSEQARPCAATCTFTAMGGVRSRGGPGASGAPDRVGRVSTRLSLAALVGRGVLATRGPRLHLPAPLRSPGITRLPRYYGCSDSCPGGGPRLIQRQVSWVRFWSFCPFCLHPPPDALHGYFLWFPIGLAGGPRPKIIRRQVRTSPVTSRLVASESRIEFVACGLDIRLGLLSTSACGRPYHLSDAVTSGFRPGNISPTRTLTLLNHKPSPSH